MAEEKSRDRGRARPPDRRRQGRDSSREEGESFDEEVDPADRIKKLEAEAKRDIRDLDEELEERRDLLREAFDRFQKLAVKDLVNDETLYREMKLRYGDYFRGGMGAEAIQDLLKQIDMDALAEELREQIDEGKGQKKQKAIKRLKVVSAFRHSSNRPEWMILEASRSSRRTCARWCSSTAAASRPPT